MLDASVGVKWLRDEAGSAEARELLGQHGDGEIVLVVPALFVFEVLDVARRRYGLATAAALWERIKRERISIVPADSASFDEVVAMAGRLGCSTYDAAAAVVAEATGAELVSADARAHGSFAGVRLIGDCEP